jgi:hypothetical protein
MFVDVLSVKVGWALREEAVEVCAARLSRMLEELASIHPSLAGLRWSGVGHQVSTRVVLELSRAGELARLFRRQRVYHSGRKLIVTDGYRFEAAGHSGEGRPIVLSVHAGNGADLPDRTWLPNEISLSFVLSGVSEGDLAIFQALKPALLALVSAWEPDWGGLYSAVYGARFIGPACSRFAGAWVVYLTGHLAQSISSPPSAVIEPCSDSAVLVSATSVPFNIDNSAHLGVADAIHASLEPSLSSARE